MNYNHSLTSVDNLQDIKRHIEAGNLELAGLDENNQPIKMQFSELQQKTNSLNKHQKLYKLIDELSYEEKYEWTNLRRLKANKLFKQGQTDKAIQIYLQALIGVAAAQQSKQKNNQSIHKQNDQIFNNINNKNQRKIKESQIKALKLQLEYPILMNIAACFYKKKQFQEGIYICDRILTDKSRIIDYHMQAMYKKAYFLYELNKLFSSRQMLVEIVEILNSNKYIENENEKIYGRNKVTFNDIKQLESLIILKNKAHKDMYRRIFKQDEEQNKGKLSQKANKEMKQQNNKSQNTQEILVYQEGWMGRGLIFIKQLMTSCCKNQRTIQKSMNNQKDEEQKSILLKVS